MRGSRIFFHDRLYANLYAKTSQCGIASSIVVSNICFHSFVMFLSWDSTFSESQNFPPFCIIKEPFEGFSIQDPNESTMVHHFSLFRGGTWLLWMHECSSTLKNKNSGEKRRTWLEWHCVNVQREIRNEKKTQDVCKTVTNENARI